MEKFIAILGQNNILIIFGIIVVIVIALFIILLIERSSTRKYALELKKYENKQEKNIEKKPNFGEKEITTVKVLNPQSEKIIYTDNKETPEEAKKAIEEAAKKMVYEDKVTIIGPTYFEKMQEENSIISYDELVNSKIQEDYDNNLLSDLGNEPITIDELYGLKEENQIEELDPPIETINDFDAPKDEELLTLQLDENSIYINNESKKFKNSDVISPVFGVKKDIVYKKEYNELGETVNIKELDIEIKKTEEFLKELKKLKNKLD